MAQRLTHPVSRRVSVPLTEQDELDLARLSTDPVYREALARVVANEQLTGSVTESVVLHAVLRAGIDAVESAAQQAGYDELAADYQVDNRRRVARRRQPSWASD